MDSLLVPHLDADTCHVADPVVAHPIRSDPYSGHMSIMMTATETKAKLLALLDEVAVGEEVQITKHGHVVACLVPARGPQSLKGRLTGVAASACEEDELFTTGVAWETAS
jgi:prevent-host-death family protein